MGTSQVTIVWNNTIFHILFQITKVRYQAAPCQSHSRLPRLLTQTNSYSYAIETKCCPTITIVLQLQYHMITVFHYQVDSFGHPIYNTRNSHTY